jgi:hypothetical protein
MIAASDIAGLRRASGDCKKTENLKAKLALKAERRPVYLTGSNFDEILHWKLIQQYGRGKAQRAANTGHLMGKSRAQL